MQKESEILKMEMAGRWSAQDLQTFLESIDSLYNFLFTLNIFEKIIEVGPRPPCPPRRVGHVIKKLDEYVPLEQRLQLYSIEYKSPGSINLQGVGGIIRELRELLERWCSKEGKRRRQLEVEGKELDIVERKIEILRKIGYNELEIRELMGFGEKKYKTIDGLI